MNRILSTATVMFLCSLGPTGIAAAQTEADQLFEEGVEGAQAGRWEEAYELFKRVYELEQDPQVLINLAAVEAQLGRLVDAVRHYEQVLASNDPNVAQHRTGVQAQLQALRQRLPVVQIRAQDLQPTDTVTLDGTELDTQAIQSPILVDPGRHTVQVVRDGHVAAERSFESVESGSTELELALPNLSVPPQPTPIDPPPIDTTSESSSVWSSPWLWLTVGAVVIAAGVVVTILVVDDPITEPVGGNLGVIPL